MNARNEPDVVIECGCITTPMGAVKPIGGKEVQLCPKGHGCDNHIPAKHECAAWHRVLREATLYERFAYHEFGTPATKRRRRGASSELLAMLGSDSTSKRSRPADNVLF